MPISLRFRVPFAALCALLLTACRHAPPPPPPQIGVHVAAAGGGATITKFTMVVTGTLEFAIQSASFAMQKDSTLLLEAPADLVVRKGAGTVVITAAGDTATLVVHALDPADSALVRARGHAIRVTRPDTTGRLTIVPDTSTHSKPETHR